MDVLLAACSLLALFVIIAAVAGAESRDGFDRDGRLDPISPLDTRLD